jgi:lipopolysaccharide biosynthesis protein
LIAKLEVASKARDASIASLERAIGTRDASIANLERAIGERDASIANLERAIGERDASIANLEQAINARDAAIGLLKKELSWRDIEGRLLHHELERRTSHMQELRGKPLVKLHKRWQRVYRKFSKVRTAKPKNRRNYSKREYNLVAASGLFDPQWYLSRYPDVACSGVDPLSHYLNRGDFEGREASPYFSAAYYRSRYADVSKSGGVALLHYLNHGIQERREPVDRTASERATHLVDKEVDGAPSSSTLSDRKRAIEKYFDRDFYLNSYPEVATSGLDPLTHFVGWGWRENRKLARDTDLEMLLEEHPELSSVFYGKTKPERAIADRTRYLVQYENSKRMATGYRDATEYVPEALERVDVSKCSVKAIAFYLPQFHPIPENDAAWGKGFTEWTNVSKAVAEFGGHYQPHLPGELGFYDLRLQEVISRQIELAKQYGIYGFCFHHYWFGGKRVLEKPVQAFLADPSLDIPFCLCWANENWTRGWDGQDHQVIIGQHHSPEDDIAFIDDLLPAFQDRRYIRLDGKPILLVYRPALLPDCRATAERWREHCRVNGVGEIFLVYAQTFGMAVEPASIGFDAAVQFPPHLTSSPEISATVEFLNPGFEGRIYDYRVLPANAAAAPAPSYPLFQTVFPSWDNTPRRPGRGHLYAYASPAAYRDWLAVLFRRAKKYLPSDRQFVFINAWNEWAEGAHLEPDRRFGYAWLSATASVIREHSTISAEVQESISGSAQSFVKRSDLAVILHLYYESLAEEFLQRLQAISNVDVFISLPNHVSVETVRLLRRELPRARLMLVQNRGRDVLPFLSALSLARELGYELLVKVHSKKSANRLDGEQLRGNLINGLLNPSTFEQLRAAFLADRQLGMLGPKQSWQSLAVPAFVVNNRNHMLRILQSLGLPEKAISDSGFFAGTMFWARVAALDWVARLGFSDESFEAEWGQVDGTLAHALERVFAIGVEARGYKASTVEDALASQSLSPARGCGTSVQRSA